MVTQGEYEDFLMHHGIKGQKWGVRKRLKLAKNNRTVANKKYGMGARIVDGLLLNPYVSNSVNTQMNKTGKQRSGKLIAKAFAETTATAAVVAVGETYLTKKAPQLKRPLTTINRAAYAGAWAKYLHDYYRSGIPNRHGGRPKTTGRYKG